MKKFKLVGVFAMVMILVSCAALQSIGITVKPYSDMTPKEKMIFLYKSYNKQYEDYKIQVAKPNLTENEKIILRGRKDALTKIYPLIQSADLALVEAKPFDPANEKLIIDYLRQLGTKLQ
ncbi:MAG: hypothetical protein KKE05_04585 [Nanoarchaeota archaeon]|nr:hypothetical protein [Nanoarchaeota archaeon]